MSYSRPVTAIGSLVLAAWWAAPAPAQWSQQKLLASVPKAGESFGWSADLEGDTAVVGSPWGGGSVRVLERDQGGPGAWGEVAELLPPGFSSFGWDAALSGDRVAVGAPNADAVYLFERDAGGPGAWGSVATLALPGSACCLLWLDLEGDTLVVGLPYAGNTGSAYIYEKDSGGPGAWGLAKSLAPAATGGEFGSDVALSGDTLVVGAYLSDTAYFFERDLGGPGAWGESGSFERGGSFGYAVDVQGDTAVVGAYSATTANGMTGGALVFVRDPGGVWSQQAILVASDGQPFDSFGSSVEIHPDETTVFVTSSSKDNPAPSRGAVYVYERHLGGIDAWGESAIHVASSPVGTNSFGFALAACGPELLVGDSADANGDGSAYLVVRASPPEPYCTAGTSASGCTALISASGTASASAAAGFFLSATGVEGAANGLFFFGVNGRQVAPWGNGTSFQCAVPPVQRAGLLTGAGTGGACDGTFSQDLNARWCPTCPKSQQNPGPGAVVGAQLWYRDPQTTSNIPTSLSDAVEFTVFP